MTKNTKKTLQGPNGLRILLNSCEIFPNDPGNGTPAMVQFFGYSSTYWCAADTGELLGTDRWGNDDVRDLTPRQLRWLQSPEVECEVADFVNTMAHDDHY